MSERSIGLVNKNIELVYNMFMVIISPEQLVVVESEGHTTLFLTLL